MTKEVTVLNNQSIYDVALRNYGQPSFLRIMQLNPTLDLSSDLTAQKIVIDLSKEEQKNANLVSYFSENNLEITTNK